MRNQINSLFKGGAIALLLCAAPSLSRADHALIVGVNEYPKLSSGSNLEGCVNDAHNIEVLLKTQGFEVVSLLNEQATKERIFDALATLKKNGRKDERFVFYFAGHGTVASNGASTLLPHDASEKNEASDIGRDELYRALLAVPARSRTVLLDSCFSGGLTRSIGGRKVKKTRAYRRATTKRINVISAKNDNNDNNDHIAGGAEIVYFTASLANQTSGEDDFESTRGGVFTHFLTSRLQKANTNTLWSEVQKDVTGEVADYMEQTQTPRLSPTEYADRRLFEGKTNPPAPKPEPKPEPKPKPDPEPKPTPAPKRTVWDDFNEDHSVPDAFTVKMSPNEGLIRINQPFNFEAKIGAYSGWLVLMEKDVDGKVYLLSPRNGDMNAAKVQANSRVRLPLSSDKNYAADAPGTERVKAILFTSEENAQALVKAFPAEGAEPRNLRRIMEVEAKRLAFYTCNLVFGVGE